LVAQVKAHLLEAIASDTELQKAEILFLGSYGRACEFLSAGDAEVRELGPVNPANGCSPQMMSLAGNAVGCGRARSQQCAARVPALPATACRLVLPMGRPECVGCNAQRLEETKATVASMRQLLETKHARLAATLDGNYPQLKHSVWQSEASQQSAVQTLMPQMTENKAKVRRTADTVFESDAPPAGRFSVLHFTRK
jgi:hypothetical protein